MNVTADRLFEAVCCVNLPVVIGAVEHQYMEAVTLQIWLRPPDQEKRTFRISFEKIWDWEPRDIGDELQRFFERALKIDRVLNGEVASGGAKAVRDLQNPEAAR